MKQGSRYFLILVAVLLLWNTQIIKPLKIFTVFLHELGHSLMAVIFGQGIQGFTVNLNESGYTLVQAKGWFSALMIANGGYLGSILFALLILYLKKTWIKNYILGTAAALLLAVSIRYSSFSFTLLYSVAFAVAIIILYMLQNERLNDWIIDIIGVASAAYAVYDIFVDTILLQINLKLHLINGWKVEQPLTDAVQLQTLTGIPAILWGIIWLVIAVSAIKAVLLKQGRSRARR